MRFGISSFITLATIARVVVAGHATLNPPLSVVRPVDYASLPPAPEPATNAKRFAQGLPPMKPRSRKHYHAGFHRHLQRATRVRSAPRAATSPLPPVQYKCNILVTETNGTPLGFVASQANEYGEFGTLTQTQDEGALKISFTCPPDFCSQLDSVAENARPSTAYPYFGGVLGFSSQDDSSFGPGQINYAYLTSVTQTPSGPPVAGASSYGEASGLDSVQESAIWSYNPTTQDITAQWINPDGAGPTTYIGLTNGVLIVTGDTEATAQGLGVDMTTVNFKCTPPVADPVVTD